MTFVDDPEFAQHVSRAVSAPQVDVRYFAFAGGSKDEHRIVEDWFTEYVDVHLQALAGPLEELSRNSRQCDEVRGILWLTRHLPLSTRRSLFCSSHFTDWVFRAFTKLYAIKRGDVSSPYSDFTGHFFALPLLLLGISSEIDVAFETPLLLTERLLPARCTWRLQGCEDVWAVLTVTNDFVRIQIDERSWSMSFDPSDDLPELIGPPGFPFQLKRRVFVSNGQIEIAESKDFPFEGFDAPSCTPWSGNQDELVGSINRGLAVLQQAWPEALEHLHCYAKTVVPYIPRERGRHNSTTTNRYFFTHGLDVGIGEELYNLGSMIHESMHCKLRILMSSLALYRNSNDDLSFRHPWMGVPRPLRGVFLGAHAFVNVMSLYHRVLEAVPEFRSVACRALHELTPQVGEALSELSKGDLTEDGAAIKAALVEHYRELIA